MIVSRQVLKEMRVKGMRDTNRKQQNERMSTNKKEIIPKQSSWRNPLNDVNENKRNLNKRQQGNQQKNHNKSQQQHIKLDNITTELNLSYRHIKQLKFHPNHQLQLRQIRQLNLSHNQIQQILPTILTPFQFLQFLDLSNNKLQKISFPYNKMGLKQLKISQNKLANLNLQHLKCLESIDASHNKLIFITLPQSIKTINLDHNMLANTYFIEKCHKSQYLSLNFNLIYDLNFNSMSQLDTNAVINKSNSSRFNNLKHIQCSNNKICHLNGLKNLNNLQVLILKNNELPLSRQNVNQLLMLESIQCINTEGNLQQGVYTYKEFQTMLFYKLHNLKSLNSKTINDDKILRCENQHSILNNQLQQQQQDHNFCLFQSSFKKQSIDDQSTIRHQNQLSLLYSGQKPFRLFLDDQQFSSQKYQQNYSQFKPIMNKCQKIYTLGDVDQDVEDNDKKLESNFNAIFDKMTVNQTTNYQLFNLKYQQSGSAAIQPNQSSSKVSQLQKSNKKLEQLQKQLSKSSQKIIIPLIIQSRKAQPTNFEINQQTKNILNLIYKLSFIPPQPLKQSSSSLIISKRLDQDEDQYFLFTKLFYKQKGILYLKKIYLLQQESLLFDQSQESQKEKDYEFGFFNSPTNSQEIYKKMIKNNCLLTDLLDAKTQSNLINYLSHIPSAFSCHHIAVRYLIRKSSAFDERSLTPVCYLIESKII